jgi:hypothetical protein
MITQTIEREKLHRAIDELSDATIMAIAPLLSFLQSQEFFGEMSWDNLNETTKNACRELDEGGGIKYASVNEMFKDLGI